MRSKNSKRKAGFKGGILFKDERLKRGTYLTEKYFDEQLECISEIRQLNRFNCRRLRNPRMLDGLLSIGERAFYGCNSIKEVWIPPSVVSIGENAFGKCPGLIMKGISGSVAKQYAAESGIPFISE